MIEINYAQLEDIKKKLKELAFRSIDLVDPLQESLGYASETEKEIIKLLRQICRKDLPNLMMQTDTLLEHIREDFQKTENQISTSFFNR